MDTIVVLDLRQLQEGIPALTPALGQVQAEAAAVCLENQRHEQRVKLVVRKVSAPQYELAWPEVTEEMNRAYNDLENATELGAYGIAILLIREQTGLTAIKQSKKGTGFDYWLGPKLGADDLPFQDSARLEVSGILAGTESQFATRLKQKVKQPQPSDKTGLQAYAVIVEFSQPQAEVATR